MKPEILIVDDVPANVHSLRACFDENFKLRVAVTGQQALDLLATLRLPDIILLDVGLPDFSGLEICRRIKANPLMKHIPVIFVTAMNTHEAQAEAYNAGGEDFIAKPIYEPVVRSRVAAHLSRYQQLSQLQKMVEVQTQQLTQTRLEIIKTLSVAAEFKDDDTGMHVIRMAHYARLLAEAYLPNDNAFGQLIFNAAPMHDIGKIGIADSILKKPGRLTPEEMDEMRKHPELGIKILREHPSELITVAREVALTHHERWNDPMGYPHKLSGEDIPIAGRIVAIADVFDALTSVRPYKQAWPIERAVQLFKDESGKHFDPTLVDLFLERLPEVLQIKEQYQEHFPEAA